MVLSYFFWSLTYPQILPELSKIPQKLANMCGPLSFVQQFVTAYCSLWLCWRQILFIFQIFVNVLFRTRNGIKPCFSTCLSLKSGIPTHTKFIFLDQRKNGAILQKSFILLSLRLCIW